MSFELKERTPEAREAYMQGWYAGKRAEMEYQARVGAPVADGIVLHLNHNEAQAILNALRESNVFPAPMVFAHVQSLAEKTQAALRAAGFEPL